MQRLIMTYQKRKIKLLNLVNHSIIYFCSIYSLHTVLVNDCKKRWRNIKDTYMKYRKTKYHTGSPNKPKTKWPLFQQLSFLKSVSLAPRYNILFRVLIVIIMLFKIILEIDIKNEEITKKQQQQQKKKKLHQKTKPMKKQRTQRCINFVLTKGTQCVIFANMIQFCCFLKAWR